MGRARQRLIGAVVVTLMLAAVALVFTGHGWGIWLMIAGHGLLIANFSDPVWRSRFWPSKNPHDYYRAQRAPRSER